MARARQYSSIRSIFPLLTVNLLALSAAEYVHRHQHGIQSKIYEHPRFGGSSIRYCAFNQYFDDREGRCMIIPGGGIAISIDESTTCSTEALRGHPRRSRNYYVCRKRNTILAECGRGKRFENRLKRCTIDTLPSIDEEDYDSHHHPYDHLHLPACERSGRFPVPQDNCTSFYACTSNGFRFFRSIHKCPASTGFDPFEEVCTTERACYDDEPGSTTSTNDRAEIFGSTIGHIVTTAARSVDEAQSIHTPKEIHSPNKSTTRFTTISTSSSSSTSGYDEAKISVSFVPAGTFVMEKIATAASFPDSIDEAVGIVRATRPTTEMYEYGGETSPFTATTYVHSFGLSEQINTSERSPIAVATNVIFDTSTANSVLSDGESTVNTSDTVDGILYNKYSFDYVTLRSDYTARQEKENESSTSTTVKMSTNNKNDESTDKTTIERDDTGTSEANETGIGSQVSYSTDSAMDNASEKWLFDKNIEGATSTISGEIPRREVTERELGTSIPVLLSSATSDAITRDIQYEEVQLTTPSGISSIDRSSALIEGSEIKSTPERVALHDAVTLTTPVDSYASSGEVSWTSLSSDGGISISPTEIVDSTHVTLTSLTPRSNEATSIQESKWTTEESTIDNRYRGSFGSLSTDTPDDEKSRTSGTELAMSTTESAYISEITEKLNTTPVTITSLTPRNDEATSIQESNSTIEEESTVADRYHGSFSSVSTDMLDNEKSTVAGTELAMSTTAYISEVTEKFDSTPVTITSLTPRSNEATSIQESNGTTEEESTVADRYYGSFSSVSTDEPDNEKSTTDDAESTMSTTEPTYITEVTAKFDSTSVTSLTPRSNEATAEPEYISEVTEKFDSTPVTLTSLIPRNHEATTEPEYISEVTVKFDFPTSLTTENNEATSIQEWNWTTEEKSTIGDPDHDNFSSFSTDQLDNEKSTTSAMESAMSTTEPTYITEVTEKFDLTPVSPTSLTIRNHETTTEEESKIAERYHGTFSSFSTDTPDDEKSTSPDTQPAMSTTEPVHISEITEKAHSKITSISSSTDDLFTAIGQHQSTIGDNSYPAFTYKSTSDSSQFGIAQTPKDSNPEKNVAVSTTSITPSLSSEPSQLENGQAQTSFTSVSNRSDYPTTVEPSAGSTNSLSTTMTSSSDRA